MSVVIGIDSSLLGNVITYHEPDRIWLKDPNEVEKYTIDWTNWLKGDAIDTSNWYSDESTPSGITVDSSSNTTTTATVTLSSGYHGGKYVLSNRITTVGGLTKEKKLIIRVMDSEYRRLCN